MKKIYFPIVLLLSQLCLSAQAVITILPGTNVFLPAGTLFSSGGLNLTPSSAITLNGVTITKTTTVSHFTLNNYVTRVYQFSNTTSPFNGTVQFYYSDAELNGLSEANLTVNLHDGTNWQPLNTASRDVTNNYVLTTAVVNKSLNELALSDAFATLPTKWGNISAYRLAQTVNIEWTTQQEFNVSHFAVERSVEGRTWTLVADNIAATNTTSAKQYLISDNYSPATRLFYRIKETDNDGKIVYSSIAAVAAANETGSLVVYPNPVHTGFTISNISASTINRVQLYNNSGMLLKTWSGPQDSYDMQDIPSGVYHLRVDIQDGSHHYFKITK